MRTQSIDATPAKDGVNRTSSPSTNLVHTKIPDAIGSEVKEIKVGQCGSGGDLR